MANSSKDIITDKRHVGVKADGSLYSQQNGRDEEAQSQTKLITNTKNSKGNSIKTLKELKSLSMGKDSEHTKQVKHKSKTSPQRSVNIKRVHIRYGNPQLEKVVTIEWDDNEQSYTCGWLLSEFIRRTTTSKYNYDNAAHQGRRSELQRQEGYIKERDEIDKLPLSWDNLREDSELIAHEEEMTTIAIRSLKGEHITLDYYLTQVEKPIQALSNDEQLEAVQIPSPEIQQLLLKKKSQKQHEGCETLENYIIEKVIGKGGFSKVMQVRNKLTGLMYAMKVLRKDKIKLDNKVEQIMIERRILEKVNHPFIIKMHSAFQSKYYLHLVLDFCPGGELFYLLSKQRRFPEPIAKFYFCEILLGIEYLHSQNIMYRDLKPENILIDLEGHIRITDFGLSKDNFGKRNRTTSFCGSPEYMSPEMLSQDFHTRMVDFYSLGALLFEMLTGLPPFYSNDRDEMYWNIVNKELSYPSYLSHESLKLLQGLLNKDPTKRLGYKNGVEELKQQEFFKGVEWDVLLHKKIKNVPLKTTLIQQNFDQEYTQLAPNLSLQSLQTLKKIERLDDEIELMNFSPSNRHTKKHSYSLMNIKTTYNNEDDNLLSNEHPQQNQDHALQNLLSIYSPSMANLDKNKLQVNLENLDNLMKGSQILQVEGSHMSPTFKNFHFQIKDHTHYQKSKFAKNNGINSTKPQKIVLRKTIMISDNEQPQKSQSSLKNYSGSNQELKSQRIRSQIGLQESGKAVFPGEKKITDESPRMEERESMEDSYNEEDDLAAEGLISTQFEEDDQYHSNRAKLSLNKQTMSSNTKQIIFQQKQHHNVTSYNTSTFPNNDVNVVAGGSLSNLGMDIKGQSDSVQNTDVVLAAYLSNQDLTENADSSLKAQEILMTSDFNHDEEPIRVKISQIRQESYSQIQQASSQIQQSFQQQRQIDHKKRSQVAGNSKNYHQQNSQRHAAQNRCVSLTPTRKMKQQFNDQMKNLYQKFAYQKNDNSTSMHRQGTMDQSQRNQATQDYQSSNQSFFVVNIGQSQINSNNTKVGNLFGAGTTSGDERSKGGGSRKLSPSILSPRSYASSLGDYMKTNNNNTQQVQKIAFQGQNLNVESHNQMLAQNAALNQNVQFKRKYNEIIGNVISERQRRVSQNNTPISHKGNPNSSAQRNENGRMSQNNSRVRKNQIQKGNFFLKNATVNTQLKINQLALRHNQLTSQTNDLSNKKASITNNIVNINESQTFGEYFINLRGLKQLESNSNKLQETNYDSANISQNNVEFRNFTTSNNNPRQTDQISPIIGQVTDMNGLLTDSSPQNQKHQQFFVNQDLKRKSALENISSASKRFGAIFSPNYLEINYTGTTTTSKHVSDHSTKKNVLQRKKSEDDGKMLSPHVKMSDMSHISQRQIEGKKLSLESQLANQKKPPMVKSNKKEMNRMNTPNFFINQPSTNSKIKSLIHEDSSKIIQNSSRKITNLTSSNYSRFNAEMNQVQTSIDRQSGNSNRGTAQIDKPKKSGILRSQYLNNSSTSSSNQLKPLNRKTNSQQSYTQRQSYDQTDSMDVKDPSNPEYVRKLINQRMNEIQSKLIYHNQNSQQLNSQSSQSSQLFINTTRQKASPNPDGQRIQNAKLMPSQKLNSEAAKISSLKESRDSNSVKSNHLMQFDILDQTSQYNILHEAVSNHLKDQQPINNKNELSIERGNLGYKSFTMDTRKPVIQSIGKKI